jgi:DNA-binding SARP family transcriptional activator
MVRVLGPVEIQRNGQTILSRSSSRRRVIAMLAAHRNTDVTLDRLTDITKSTPAAIRTIVSRLRHDLGADVLRTTSAGYSINPERCDATLAERLLAEARTSRCTDALALVEEALSSWRGRAFGAFADEAWAEAEAARLGELEHSAHEDHADLLIVTGRYDEAIVELRGHIITYPFRDRPRRSLMVALDRAGRTAEALREFQAYRRFLAEEAGIGPSSATVAVERTIAAGAKPAFRSPGGQTDAAAVRAVDLEGIGLALARLLLHGGHQELAARAVGACGSTQPMDTQITEILDEISEALGSRRLHQLLTEGRRCTRGELYRELWAAAQPLLEGSTEPGAPSASE